MTLNHRCNGRIDVMGGVRRPTGSHGELVTNTRAGREAPERRVRASLFTLRALASSEAALKDQAQNKILQSLDSTNILGFGADLAEDHPGYADMDYKQRRASIARMALDYRLGDAILPLKYLPEERSCWGMILRELGDLYPTHACQEFNENLGLFEFNEAVIPQLEDVSQIIRKASGWRIHPVAGLLHPREFLKGLACRVFHSTQYMRHPSQPMYTPEPDICHELLGHCVMLANPHYANLVQAIGTASLGADEKQIWHLTKVYWYTVEFGAVQEGDEVKAFGAGLLSSFGELQHFRSGTPQLWPFDPFQKQPKMSYKDGYQKGYFVLESFEQGARQLHDFCERVTKP